MIETIDGKNDIVSSLAVQEAVWSGARTSLSQALPDSTFNTWINRLKPIFNPNCSLTLEAPNYFFKNFIERFLINDIQQAVANKCQELGCDPVSEINIVESKTAASDIEYSLASTSPHQNQGPPDYYGQEELSQSTLFNPKFIFENFVVGATNSLAYHAAKAFSSGQNLGTGILYLTSDPGLGKSHLAQALGQNFLSLKCGSLVKYLTFETFTNEMVHNLNQRTMEDFKRKYREQCDLLMLEGATFLHNKLNIQQELCYTLDFLINKGKKVVLTSTKVPHDIPKMDQSLRSRLSSSLVAQIGHPDFNTRLGILEKLAQNYNHPFGKQVLEYVAHNVKDDVRQLECCLYTLDANHVLLKKNITMSMAEEVVDSVTGRDENKTGLTKVVKLICRVYNLEEGELRSKSRRRNINEARSLGMYLAKSLTAHTLSEIGEAFGRCHSTAIYSIHKVKKVIPNDQKLKVKLEYLMSQLGQAN
ncbi:MAG: chromosomal replication initiator protein DnaA [Deltaproteobacteria bacterium]|jgi:chromosomal replication initiator protein|nr:chromosomal replication initiator protein DnaA [Deltaproteobacteria bacterium]